MDNHYVDVTREQFEIIRPLLEPQKKRTRPKEYDTYEIFCALLYVLKTGCQWRLIPKDFPKWQLVYYYFRIWKKKREDGTSILEDALKKMCWRGAKKQWSERENITVYC